MDTTGKLMYSVDDGIRPYAYSYTRTEEQRAQTPHQPEDTYTIREAVEVPIKDARPHEMNLTDNGFQLVQHPTALTPEDFYGDEVRQRFAIVFLRLED